MRAVRQDLYYRLAELVVASTPLRQRTDTAELIAAICRNESDSDFPATLSDEAARIFEEHPWPGNVRQLHGVLRTAIAMLSDEGVIHRSDLSEEFLEEETASSHRDPILLTECSEAIGSSPSFAKYRLDEIESPIVKTTLEANNGNITIAEKTARRQPQQSLPSAERAR